MGPFIRHLYGDGVFKAKQFVTAMKNLFPGIEKGEIKIGQLVHHCLHDDALKIYLELFFDIEEIKLHIDTSKYPKSKFVGDVMRVDLAEISLDEAIRKNLADVPVKSRPHGPMK